MSRAPSLPVSDPELRFAALPTGRLAYTDEGPEDGPALIAVHGLPGSVRDFRYLAPQLGGQVRLLRLDLPGFGGSAHAEDAIDLSGRGLAVRRLADHLGLGRFAVLGHSMGGGAALAVAAALPDRVSHLVLLSSVALSRHRGIGFPIRMFGFLAVAIRVPVLSALIMALSRRQLRRRGFRDDDITPDSMRLQFRILAATDFALLRDFVARPLPPTLLAYAQDDHMVETPVSDALARALPTARTLVFDSGGHNIQKHRAVEIGEAVQRLLVPVHL